MSKYLLKSINELHEEKGINERLEKKFKDVEVVLTKDELKMLLDNMIESRCKWKLLDHYPELTRGRGVDTIQSNAPLMLGEEIKPVITQRPTDENLTEMAETVYKDIVSDFSYNDKIVLATRAVKPFDVAYVKSVIVLVNKQMAKKANK